MNGPTLSFGHLPVIPLFPRWGIEGDRFGFCPLRTPQRGEKGTEGGQIGSSPPRTPPGERGRTIWMANLQFPAVG